jgi:hypothetical protein
LEEEHADNTMTAGVVANGRVLLWRNRDAAVGAGDDPCAAPSGAVVELVLLRRGLEAGKTVNRVTPPRSIPRHLFWLALLGDVLRTIEVIGEI